MPVDDAARHALVLKTFNFPGRSVPVGVCAQYALPQERRKVESEPRTYDTFRSGSAEALKVQQDLLE